MLTRPRQSDEARAFLFHDSGMVARGAVNGYNHEKGLDSMIVKCPMCKKETPWEGNPFRPFCSERCKLLDLGAWAKEEYRIAGDKARDDDGEKEDAS